MTSLELVPASVLVILFGCLAVRKGLGTAVSDFVEVTGRLETRGGLGVPVSTESVLVLGRLTIRKGLGMSTPSSQSDQNSISSDSNDPDAIFCLVSLSMEGAQTMDQLENAVIALPPSRRTNLARFSSPRRAFSSLCKKTSDGTRSLQTTS